MSQAGVLDVTAANPQIPTRFDTDSGSAVPIGNVIEILGGTSSVTTSGSGNTILINVTAGSGQTITGNNGVPISPSAGNWNTLGLGSITIQGSGSTLETQLQGLTNHALLIGAGTTTITKLLPHATPGIPIVSQGAVLDPAYGIAIVGGGGTGTGAFNINGVLISNTTSTGSLSSLTLANGQFVIGSTGTTPVASTLTSSGGTITITPGAGTLNIDTAGGGISIDSIHPDSGTDPVVPTGAGLVNIIGSGSTTTVGSLNTLTVELTGLTNHALLVGAGTTTITKVGPTATTGQVLQNNAAADPSYSTATYPSTTTISQLLYSSAANTVAGLATANRGVLTTGTTGVPVITALATDGQLIIGSTAGAPAAASLTAGSGITITPGSNSITIAASGGSGITSVVIQTFTASDTYTPTSGMVYCIIEVVGGGGGGGGAGTSAGNQGSGGAGGGAGGYSKGIFDAATIGASQTVTIGAAGSAGSAGANAGGGGGTTSVGALIQATGGSGGAGGTVQQASIGGAAGVGSLGSINVRGNAGSSGIGSIASTGQLAIGGIGGASFFGGQPIQVMISGGTPSTAGTAGQSYGAGGGGGGNFGGAGPTAGGAGVAGVVTITEYVS